MAGIAQRLEIRSLRQPHVEVQGPSTHRFVLRSRELPAVPATTPDRYKSPRLEHRLSHHSMLRNMARTMAPPIRVRNNQIRSRRLFADVGATSMSAAATTKTAPAARQSFVPRTETAIFINLHGLSPVIGKNASASDSRTDNTPVATSK